MRGMRRGGVVHGLARAVVTAGLWLVLAMPVVGASPTPSALPGGDPRSSGQGPGLVGDPVFAVVGVLVIGLGALVLTLVYVRMTARRDA